MVVSTNIHLENKIQIFVLPRNIILHYTQVLYWKIHLKIHRKLWDPSGIFDDLINSCFFAIVCAKSQFTKYINK